MDCPLYQSLILGTQGVMVHSQTMGGAAASGGGGGVGLVPPPPMSAMAAAREAAMKLQSDLALVDGQIVALRAELKKKEVEIVDLKDQLRKLTENTDVKNKDRAAVGFQVAFLRKSVAKLEKEKEKVAANIKTLLLEKRQYEAFITDLYKLLDLGKVKPTTGGVVTQGNTTSFGKKMNFEKSWALYKLVHDKKLNNSLKKLARK